MTVRDLLEALSMTGAQTAILEEGGTWRAVQPVKLFSPKNVVPCTFATEG